ncbi:hypothetical protein SAMN05428969_0445 [Devosia sp. YR412]|uniref:hypothetical protein n=1 Tax=Devosia sp. YR412 TaxID=1881030 RepID=UPI0008BD3953|nr:hypothetical protein [Devosia sp. YR412]SEP68336.1 hypothetical protein SAMN05428969_0445 [Devosia sp. YR412]
MRIVAYFILASLGIIIGYSAFAQQQSGQSRLGAEDIAVPLVAQAPEQPAPAQPSSGVTTTLETPPTVAAPTTTTAPAASTTVDETALRYFARQGDTARMQAELERLRSLHPGWEPPTNLLSDEYVPDADIVRIWDLFSAGDYAGARAALATKQAADPSFVASQDLLDSLALGEAGLRLRNASDAKQYETVISVAANFPALLTCESIDNLWRLAEAFARTDNVPRSLDAYSYVLNNCSDVAQRYATLQKAIELLDRADLAPLLALERPATDGRGEFADLRLDLARRAVAASLAEGGEKPLPEDITLLEQMAQDSANAEDMRLLGWSELAQDRNEAGRRWFEAAMKADPSAASAQGLGTALLDLGDPEGAEEALADYADESEEITGLYLDASAALLALQPRVELTSNVLGRIVAAVMDARQATAAQELGWYAYDFQQPETAVEWFTLALRWQPDLEPAAYGLMVASNALGDTATVESIRTRWGPSSARIASFGRDSGSAVPPAPQQRVVQPTAAPAVVQAVQVTQTAQTTSPATQSSGQGSSASGSCTSFVPAGSLSSGAALGHAWCLMQLNRPAQAVDHFTRALQSGSERTRSDAAYGLSLAYVRLGLADNAAVAAAAAPISDRQAVELEIAILSEKAISAYNIGDYRRALDALDARARYAPERNDLLTLRAWSYYHIKRYRESQRIFEAVAATGYGEAVGGLQAATDALARSLQTND